MHKLSRAAPYIAYAVATAGMAVLLLLGSSPGAIIARSYQAYNGCPVPGSPEYTYQDVNLPFSVPLSPVTAVEARAKKRRIYFVRLSPLPLLPQFVAGACRRCGK